MLSLAFTIGVFKGKERKQIPKPFMFLEVYFGFINNDQRFKVFICKIQA